MAARNNPAESDEPDPVGHHDSMAASAQGSLSIEAAPVLGANSPLVRSQQPAFQQ